MEEDRGTVGKDRGESFLVKIGYPLFLIIEILSHIKLLEIVISGAIIRFTRTKVCFKDAAPDCNVQRAIRIRGRVKSNGIVEGAAGDHLCSLAPAFKLTGVYRNKSVKGTAVDRHALGTSYIIQGKGILI